MDENDTAEEQQDNRELSWIDRIPAALGIRLL